MIERTVITKKRQVPEWLVRAIAKEREELASIDDPVRRRMAELDLDEIETRVNQEIRDAQV